MMILQVYFQHWDSVDRDWTFGSNTLFLWSGAFPDEVLGEVFEFEVSL